jgi:nitric oxide synthase oxygenase domain/subunit
MLVMCQLLINTVIGDPAMIELTKICSRFGWNIQERYRRSASLSHFDILLVIIQMPGQPPELFEITKIF